MKKILSLFLVLFVFLSSALMTSAQGEYVVDDADLLTEDMEATLLSEISSIQENYGIDIVLHTTMSIGYEDIHSYSENFYLTNGYGEDGLVFVINLNNNEVGNRDFYTYYQGTVYDTFGDEAYNSDYGFVNQNILPYLANEDYYTAIETYLKMTESYITGEIYDNGDFSDDYYTGDYWVDDGYYVDDYYTDGAIYPSEPMSPVIKELIVIAIAGIVAFVMVSFMKSKMNTAVIKTEASDYVKAGSMNITRRLDVFTHRHVTRTAKPKNNSSSGGSRAGGSIGGGGGGRSGGGGGKF